MENWNSHAEMAQEIMKAFQRRRIQAWYCQDRSQAKDLILSLMPPGSSIGWGGSKTLEQIGVMDAIRGGQYQLFDRDMELSQEERKAVYASIQTADYFLTGSNAVTQDGVLINVDGRSDRVSFLCHGPRNVIVAVGMNKIVPDISSGLERVWKTAGPMNAKKLGRDTPCAATGVCNHCLSPECLCSNIVITRRSAYANRIQVVLIDEELGF